MSEVGHSDWRSIKLEDMGLPTRAYNALRRGMFYTAGDVYDAKDAELLRCPELGRGTLNEIREAMAANYGLPAKSLFELMWDEKRAVEDVRALEERLKGARERLRGITEQIRRVSPTSTAAIARAEGR